MYIEIIVCTFVNLAKFTCIIVCVHQTNDNCQYFTLYLHLAIFGPPSLSDTLMLFRTLHKFVITLQ